MRPGTYPRPLDEEVVQIQHIKKQRHHFADKGPSSQSYGISSSHVCMWELDHKESWTLKNWCFWTVRYADGTTLMAESEEELKSLLMKAKVESKKVGLKLNIQKTKIMASSPNTLWEIDGETVETVSGFILGGSEITADGECSH